MEYVGNGFSPNMIESNATIEIQRISKATFEQAIRDGAKSIIGHPEISEMFKVPLNRVSITLDCGDTLYLVTPNQRLNTTEYTFIPETEGYVYRKITVKRLWKQ